MGGLSSGGNGGSDDEVGLGETVAGVVVVTMGITEAADDTGAGDEAAAETAAPAPAPEVVGLGRDGRAV